MQSNYMTQTKMNKLSTGSGEFAQIGLQKSDCCPRLKDLVNAKYFSFRVNWLGVTNVCLVAIVAAVLISARTGMLDGCEHKCCICQCKCPSVNGYKYKLRAVTTTPTDVTACKTGNDDRIFHGGWYVGPWLAVCCSQSVYHHGAHG
jgi:hypothetical protein